MKVPRRLQTEIGATHIRRALGTRDLDEAVRRKWDALARVHAYFSAVGQRSCPELARPLSNGPVAPIAINCTPPPQQPAVQSIAIAAKPSTTLDVLLELWLDSSEALKTTRFQRRQAYLEVRRYLGGDSLPSAVSSERAAEYVDEHLRKSIDSVGTKRRKLSALGAFWEWMSMRRFVPRGENPWRGFRIRADSSRSTPKKRPYTFEELVRLFSGQPTYPALREVMALGLYTGARIDEICSLLRDDVRWAGCSAIVRITKSKTVSGTRSLVVSHPVPVAILRARTATELEPAQQLFPELRGGGYDKKLSWHVGQAFRYHRNKQGLNGETDFHSLRRTFITRLENLSVDQVHIARYVGHALPTLAFKVYSGGATEATQRATGAALTYPAEVEEAVQKFLSVS